jgi:menaquinone-9 beta-reductase
LRTAHCASYDDGAAMTSVIVVGGGPVGLATAIEARLAGLDVTVFEPREHPIDKACGEGLMPGALPLLARLGVAPAGAPFLGIEYHDARRSVRHEFATGPGLGVRRTELSTAFRDRATDLGVDVIDEKVDQIDHGDDWVSANAKKADWMIGADGLHSTVARLTGLALAAPRSRRRYGQRRHFRSDARPDAVAVHWGSFGELYVTPMPDDTVGVALLARRGVDFAAAVAAVPAIADTLGEPVNEVRGAGPFRQRTRARTAGRVLLVGDASGYVDAITGEGLRLGFDQARAAISAVSDGQPRQYETEWRAITRAFRSLTGGLALAASSPFRGAVVPLARRLQSAFGSAVESLAR